MAYNTFTLNKLKADFGINQVKSSFIPRNLPALTSSQRLLDQLNDAEGMPLASEKAKSEFIIKPVLMEMVRLHRDKITMFSGYTFDVDKAQKLAGRCDFMIANQPYLVELNAPVFCMVESKNGILEDGFGQCGAEMYATQIYNQQQGYTYPAIYGCATTGYTWAFLKLENNTLFIDNLYIPLSLTAPENVLAVLEWIIEQY